jgi:hypothetical protein
VSEPRRENHSIPNLAMAYLCDTLLKAVYHTGVELTLAIWPTSMDFVHKLNSNILSA